MARRTRRVAAVGVLALVGSLIPTMASPADTGRAPGASAPVQPCGKGNAKGATDTGVTDDAIRIATIQDVGGPAPGLFEDEQHAVEAFVAWCNSQGGINGRKLELDKYDSALLEAYPQYVKACDSAFAIVGEAVIFDDAAVKPTTECGIPSIATTTQEKRIESDNVFSPNPNPGGLYAAGRFKWLAKRFPGVDEKAAMFYPSVATGKNSGEKQIAGAEAVGWEFTYRGVTEINTINWGPYVDQLRQHGSTYLTMVSDFNNYARLQREMAAQGVKVQVLEANAKEYTPDYITAAGTAAEGTLIPLTTAPFEDANKIPELKNYLKWTKKVGGTPGSLPVIAWSSGLLFATVVKSLGSNVTREGLIEGLKAVHAWDGNGIQALADVGAKKPTGCWVELIVKDNKFARFYPKKGFACDETIVKVPTVG